MLELNLRLRIEHRSGVSFEDQTSGGIKAREIKMRRIPIPLGKKKESEVSDSNAHYEHESIS